MATSTSTSATLASGAKVTYTVTVQPTVAAPADSPLSNSATITGNEHDPNTGNNTSHFSTAVLPAVDLAIVTFTASPGTLEIGHQLTYTAIVTNHGPSPATGVTLTSPLGNGVSFVSASATQGTVVPQGSSVVASLNDLAAGASATVTFVVVPSVFGSLTATVNVTSNETDTSPSNNSGSTMTTVLDRPGTIEFAVSSYVVAENAGSATITVSRVLARRGTVTVDYTTEPMSAISRPRLHAGFGHSRVSGRCAV